jgi:WhiB family redox-sensing transcriptional regulator
MGYGCEWSGPDGHDVGDRMSAEWFDDAACKGQPSDLWFPDNGEVCEAAKQVCNGCSVRGECLAYALTNRIDYGVWGGASAKQRQRMRRKNVAGTLSPSPLLHRLQLLAETRA